MRLILPAISIAGLLLSGCAGRAPEMVAIVKPEDLHLNCEQISAEIVSNNKRISELTTEQNNTFAQNIVAGAAGAVVPVFLLASDFQNAALKEEVALSQRNQHLAGLAQQRCARPTETASTN